VHKGEIDVVNMTCVHESVSKIVFVRFSIVFLCAGILAACSRSPEPLEKDSVTRELRADLISLGAMPDPLDKPVSLYDAIARAILYNQEYKLSAMEAALSQSQLDLANANTLPALTLNAGYSSRDNYAASVSTPFTGDKPAPLPANEDDRSYSISQDKQRTTSSAAFTWNILDFGLSYVRAGQASNRRLIALERQRKVIHNIVREVTAAYWRAAAAENLLGELGPLLRRLEAALEDSERIEERRLSSPIEALIYQKELLEIRRTLHSQQRALMTARLELAQLMGLMPGQRYELRAVEYIIPEIAMNLSLMENTALLSRPELMEVRYQKRVGQAEVRAALLSMLPGLSFNVTASFDDSDYQKYQDYVEMGSQVSWNLMSAFSGPANRRVAKAGLAVTDQQRLALAMAVVSQVHISNMNFVQARREYAVSEDYLDVSRRLTSQTRAAQKVAKFGELEVIRQEASLLLARMRRDIAFAELQNSFGTVYASIGLDIVPETVTDMTLPGLTAAIEQSLQNWGIKYDSVMAEGLGVLRPIEGQNPVIDADGFTFAADTFDVGAPVSYSLNTQNGAPLPDWLVFNPAERFLGGEAPMERGELNLRLVAQGPDKRASDSFILKIGQKYETAPLPAKSPAPAATSPVPAAPSPVPAAPAIAAQAVEPVGPAKPVKQVKSTASAKPAASNTAPYFVQAKAFRQYKVAKKFADSVNMRVGLQTFVRKTKRRKPALYRVIIPAFSRENTEMIIDRLRVLDINDAFVTRN
jgi:outer membrane protein TolC